MQHILIHLNTKNAYLQILNEEESMSMTPIELRGSESECEEARQLIEELTLEEDIMCMSSYFPIVKYNIKMPDIFYHCKNMKSIVAFLDKSSLE